MKLALGPLFPMMVAFDAYADVMKAGLSALKTLIQILLGQEIPVPTTE